MILEDPIGGPLKQRRFRLGVALLARKIAAPTTVGETVGLMLPNANGAAVAFMAVQAAGRVAAMLNFTSGAFNLIAACRTAEIRLVLCSRAFVEKGKLDDVVEQMEPHVRFVWLEDLRDGATLLDKARAFLDRGPRVRAAPARTTPPWCSSPPDRRACPRGSCFPTPTFSPISRRSPRASISPRRTSCSTRCRFSTPSA